MARCVASRPFAPLLAALALWGAGSAAVLLAVAGRPVSPSAWRP